MSTSTEGAASRLGETSTPEEKQVEDSARWSAVRALGSSAAMSGLLLGLIAFLLIYISDPGGGILPWGREASDGVGRQGPEGALAIMFVAAAVILILVVCTLTIVLKRLGLHDKSEAMGLPVGSVRAIIALLLILLFFIAAVFLFNSTRRVPPSQEELRTLQGIDEARFATIPTDLIYDSDRQVAEDGTVSYDVVLSPSPMQNEASDDLAKQLVTTLATLVTAVAAFYFGAASVSAQHKVRDIKGDGLTDGAAVVAGGTGGAGRVAGTGAP
jgi:uncharacterized membrane protein YhaH (DUF805 family)